MTNKELDDNHELIVNAAVAAAMAATEPPPRSRASKVLTAIFTFIVLFSFAGSWLTVYNSYVNGRQGDDLKTEQACLVSLIKNLESDTAARSQIAADDRQALRELVRRISNAKTREDTRAALDEFNKQSLVNDKNRSKYPVNISVDCSISEVVKLNQSPTKPASPTPTVTTSPTNPTGKPSPTSTAIHTP